MRTLIHSDATKTAVSDMNLHRIYTEPTVFSLLKFLHFLIFLTRQQNVSLLFSEVRMYLAEQDDPFGHTWPIGRRLVMAVLEDLSYIFIGEISALFLSYFYFD